MEAARGTAPSPTDPRHPPRHHSDGPRPPAPGHRPTGGSAEPDATRRAWWRRSEKQAFARSAVEVGGGSRATRGELAFPIGAQVAQRYQEGRVFPVGDAARINPPTGGLGGSRGVQDVLNLAWKLAAVLRGEAGPGLLATYHPERHPVGQLTMQQALARFGARQQGEGTDAPPQLDSQVIAFGYQYRSQAVLGAPDDGAPPLSPAELTGQPGTRAPHLPVIHDGREISTIDLYGRQLVLLAGAGGVDWVKAADAVADRLGVGVPRYRFGAELQPAAGAGAGEPAHGISPDGALLVRPDGFVAWRSTGAASDPAAELERALGMILGRPEHG